MINRIPAAPRPPMGWNSWDCYGAGITEKDLLANAAYMAEYLRDYGWQYVVCDIQWYEPGAVDTDYNNFAPLCMDEYARLIPAENRFPSAAGGRGFAVIAEKIHEMGLKFGVHMLRGIPTGGSCRRADKMRRAREGRRGAVFRLPVEHRYVRRGRR